MTTHYDCIILGAGPAGLSSALRLRLRGWKVAIVERMSFPREKVCGGFIGPENKELLQSFGVWDQICEQGIHLHHIVL